MDVQGITGARMNEEYWQAILQQGEESVNPSREEMAELWEGFGEGLSNSPPDKLHARRDGGSNTRWALARDMLETGEVLEAQVVGYNRGGLLVDWDGLRGFVPASHLSRFSSYSDEEKRRSELAQRVGECLKLRVIELDAAEDRFILSERAATDQAQHCTELLYDLQPGDICQGEVTNLCSFGAFVDLGGVEGLIHISELSWGRIDHPRDVLESGQSVEVYVLNVHPEQNRIGLSLKRLLPDPWQTVEERYTAGQLVEGVVTNVVSFGAFVRLEEGLEGLVHVSELAEGNFLHPRNVVQEGDEITARVLSVEGQRRRMALSLRQANQNTLADQQAEKEAWTASSATAVAYQR